MATLLLLRRWQAVKIALEVKKYLVDHSMLEVTQVSTSVSGRQAFVYSCIGCVAGACCASQPTWMWKRLAKVPIVPCGSCCGLQPCLAPEHTPLACC